MVYHIWRARNVALFQSKSVTNMGIMMEIVDEIQHVMLAWGKIPRTQETWKLAWNGAHPLINVSPNSYCTCYRFLYLRFLFFL